jgi:hypothetical protein
VPEGPTPLPVPPSVPTALRGRIAKKGLAPILFVRQVNSPQRSHRHVVIVPPVNTVQPRAIPHVPIANLARLGPQELLSVRIANLVMRVAQEQTNALLVMQVLLLM